MALLFHEAALVEVGCVGNNVDMSVVQATAKTLIVRVINHGNGVFEAHVRFGWAEVVLEAGSEVGDK